MNNSQETEDNESKKLKGKREDDTVPAATGCRNVSVQERGTQYNYFDTIDSGPGVVEKFPVLPGPSALGVQPQHDEAQGATGGSTLGAQSDPEHSSRNSFWCYTAFFRGFKNQHRTRFAWYISDDKAKLDQSNIVAYEDDNQECVLDGQMAFYFQDYLCLSIAVQSNNGDFYLSPNEKQERHFTREHICEISQQKLMLPIEWNVERNDSACGIGDFKVTFKFKTSRDETKFTKVITRHHECEGQILGENPMAIPMPSEDRNAIRECLPRLINEICNIKEFARRLYQKDILTKDEENTFSKKGKTKEKAFRLFLRVQRRGNVFEYLQRALQNTEKEENSATILRKARKDITSGRIKIEENYPLCADERKVIRSCYQDLISCIGNETDILAELYSRGILNEDKIERIWSEETDSEKFAAILDVVTKNGRKLSDFIDILRCTGNEAAARLIRKKSSFHS